jgi:hypothetical protein
VERNGVGIMKPRKFLSARPITSLSSLPFFCKLSAMKALATLSAKQLRRAADLQERILEL